MRKRKKKSNSPKAKEKKMDSTNISDFDGRLVPNYNRVVMQVNGLSAALHMPEALKREIDPFTKEEKIHQLPPGAPRAAFPVDEYPACPETWMHGSAKASSYFVPIKADKGMWLDMNGNNGNTHHIAAVISVQGINPTTGQKTDKMRLEQYRTNCPVHNIEFGQDLFCSKCKHKWPPQNYLSTNNGGPFWLDGFMASDGVVRQWIFSEEEAKGVAAQLIKQDRVFAIGIAFFKSKKPKPIVTTNVLRCASFDGGSKLTNYATPSPLYSINFADSGSIACCAPGPTGPAGPTGPTGLTGVQGPVGVTGCAGITLADTLSVSQNIMDRYSDDTTLESYPDITAANHLFANDATGDGSRGIDAEEKTSGGIKVPATRGSRSRMAKSIPDRAIKKLEVGAGARIDQRIFADPENVDFWEEEPAGMIYVNYCTEEAAKEIIAAGKREEATDGFLAEVKLAN